MIADRGADLASRDHDSAWALRALLAAQDAKERVERRLADELLADAPTLGETESVLRRADAHLRTITEIARVIARRPAGS